jgi:rod shape-determining protein MreC
MESFFSRYKNALILIVVLVAQLLALAVQVKRPAADSADQRGVSLIRYLVVSVVTPPERWLHNVGTGIRGLWFGYLDLVHVRKEDAALKEEIERLRLEQASLAEDAKQGERLQQLLHFKQQYIYKTVPAQVIGVSGTEQSQTLFIDKGSKEGLAQDMPVVTADGIVGRLREVFDHKSLVLLISDPTSGVGVILETTRTRGILKGGSFGQIQVINVSPDDRIKPGERIVTSGGDQIFPRGIPVGTVERVVPDPDRDPLVDVAVRPMANLSRLEEVLVITSAGDMASPQAAKDLAESEAEGAAEQKRASDVLAERLPGRLDVRAPADTNPDTKVGEAAGGNIADDVRLTTPPRPLRPDQYSPDATPPSTEMTPGQRRAAVMQGTEDIVPSAAQKKSVATASETNATGHPVTPNGNGTGGEVKKTTTASTTATASPATTTATKPASGSTGVKLATGSLSSNSSGSAAASPVAATAKPVKPATGSTLPGGNSTSAEATGSSRPPSTGFASPSASETSVAGGAPKVHVIVDGPLPGGRVSSDSNRTSATVSAPVKKGPEIVPDDGSRPPSPTKPAVPKPKPTAQPAQGATPPNGER